MPASRYKLVIGNKMWSSWSLWPWLLMRQAGIAFDEINIALRTPETADAIKVYSPSGKIPALVVGDLTIWDSLAIMEYLADAHPDYAIWPRSGQARAIARAVSAEMHSGFGPLRVNCPMDFTARGLVPLDEGAITADVMRIVEIWGMCRTTFGNGGAFLFGEFSAADAMFAPVASRFVTYGIDLTAYCDDGAAADYVSVLMALPAMAEWGRDGDAEQAQGAGMRR